MVVVVLVDFFEDLSFPAMTDGGGGFAVPAAVPSSACSGTVRTFAREPESTLPFVVVIMVPVRAQAAVVAGAVVPPFEGWGGIRYRTSASDGSSNVFSAHVLNRCLSRRSNVL